MVWRDLSTNSVRDDGWARPSILERPKVIYNKVTRRWVMWVHSDGPSSPTSTSTYARAEAGVAIADSPVGMAWDMNLFVDDDGTGHIIYSSEQNRTMYISKLNQSYTYLSAAPENAVQGKDFVRTPATPTAVYTGEVGADGKLTVTIAPTRAPDIQVSRLMVAKN